MTEDFTRITGNIERKKRLMNVSIDHIDMTLSMSVCVSNSAGFSLSLSFSVSVLSHSRGQPLISRIYIS